MENQMESKMKADVRDFVIRMINELLTCRVSYDACVMKLALMVSVGIVNHLEQEILNEDQDPGDVKELQFQQNLVKELTEEMIIEMKNQQNEKSEMAN